MVAWTVGRWRKLRESSSESQGEYWQWKDEKTKMSKRWASLKKMKYWNYWNILRHLISEKSLWRCLIFVLAPYLHNAYSLLVTSLNKELAEMHLNVQIPNVFLVTSRSPTRVIGALHGNSKMGVRRAIELPIKASPASNTKRAIKKQK